ncbi:MAG: hypoxanthine-guanine phosphoribosyltransferase [Xanthomonadaceae bacterium]|nr:hypoxanthine-guanine phosphoribosyltransferase [Xanthomonadaceae bacterium]
MTAPRLAEALRDADLLFDRRMLDTAIARIADAIRADYPDPVVAEDGTLEPPPLYVTIMHGGLPFAAQLAFALGERGLDMEFDYLHATRYRGSTSGSGLAWLHRPATPMRGRRVLLADDILDEGHTLLAVKRWCEDQGAADVRVAVLARKIHDRCVDDIEADYIGVEVPDRYVFGYGMDYREQGRNLPAIYALKE